jgi:hypothetical protein
MAAIPRAQDVMVAAIAQYISDPAVQVITAPAGLLDRLLTRRRPGWCWRSSRKPQNSLTCDRHLARHPEGHPPRLRAGRADRARHAGAQGLAARPGAGQRRPRRADRRAARGDARATLVQAAAKAGRRKLGYVVHHGEDLVAAKAAQVSGEVADAARSGVPPTFRTADV